ncbi:hypothetical protein J6590_004266 [Homalodisca vitripennis]|nr:hypothetical protein J6590_004266 [Homalodisca vitripennis]
MRLPEWEPHLYSAELNRSANESGAAPAIVGWLHVIIARLPCNDHTVARSTGSWSSGSGKKFEDVRDLENVKPQENAIGLEWHAMKSPGVYGKCAASLVQAGSVVDKSREHTHTRIHGRHRRPTVEG